MHTIYDLTDHPSNVTFGAESLQEMSMQFFLYYPRIELNDSGKIIPYGICTGYYFGGSGDTACGNMGNSNTSATYPSGTY